MSERSVQPNEAVITNQRRAGVPNVSAWVEANAGSGKTHVLIERVLRLLLSGAAPENLLCLTYTKAAAAEMRRRVAARLGQWAVMEDAQLNQELLKLEDAQPDAKKRARARTLFGHALETPGGLKINTIHAFCESVLQRFPLEAGVPFGFSVIEEGEQADLIRSARDKVLAKGIAGQGPAAEAVSVLFAQLSDFQLEEAVNAAIAKRENLRAVLADRTGAKENLRDLLRLKADESADDLLAQVISKSLFAPIDYAEVFALCPPDITKTRFEDKLARIDKAAPDPKAIMGAFLKNDGTVPAKFPKSKLANGPAGLGARLSAEAERLQDVAAKINAAQLLARSNALIDILGAIFDRYEAQKRARSLLDFDDLIAHMIALLNHGDAREWVRYKLDASIAHILVDESQDTNPEQWALIDRLTEELFAGDGIARAPRTLFAVGDKKQSIYSFQGAVPQMFGDKGRTFEMRAKRVAQLWDRVPLTTSFRTLENILSAVDRVCATPEVAMALLIDEGWAGHDSARTHKGGQVTLWPPIRQQEAEMPEDRWPLDSDAVELRNAARQVAEHIAQTAKGWIDNRRPLQQRGRAVSADDILILVQSRGALFQEIMRALKKTGLPTPGADRLSVSSHIAVRDLLALADILLNPADDLILAAVLRSPLFDVSEAQLFDLAAQRGKNTSLWQRLQTASAPHFIAAYERLYHWRSRLDFERPYDFFARLLYAEGGLQRFHARLGEEVDDVLAEFLDLALDHERAAQPSLQGFLAAMRKSAISIKREFGEKGGGVRVMTVHGAKGLEAPIVILADAATGPNVTKMAEPLYLVPQKPGPLLIHASATASHVEQTLPFRQADIANQTAEYWRKLYVAMTRAEDELYVTGVLTKKKSIEGTWYEAIKLALAPEAAPCAVAARDEEGLVYPAVQSEAAQIKHERPTAPAARKQFIPDPLPTPPLRKIITPSTAHKDDDAIFDSAAQSIIDAETARLEGIALHAMLQHLSKIEPNERTEVATRALETLLPDAPARHDGLIKTALEILSDPQNARIFGPNSRAEVPFLTHLEIKGKPVRIAGRIDRLIVEEHVALAVDFKSDANPPQNISEVSAGYMTQLALYVQAMEGLFAPREMQAAIFWTATRTLMLLPKEKIAQAIDKFTP